MIITLVLSEGKLYSTFLTLFIICYTLVCPSSYIMHHGIHFIMLSRASFIMCSMYKNEETHVDQVSEGVHPPEVLVPIGTISGD
jgi:hypothetical protein